MYHLFSKKLYPGLNFSTQFCKNVFSLIKRFDKNPKPMCYHPDFLNSKWEEYLQLNNCKMEEVDPDTSVRWTYAKALEHRNPIYKAMASWGITVQADLISKVKTPEEFNLLIGSTLLNNKITK